MTGRWITVTIILLSTFVAQSFARFTSHASADFTPGVARGFPR
jgi:hypothetical protein